MLFFLSGGELARMARRETASERLNRIIDEAVKAGAFPSRAEVLRRAKVSSGYLAELKQRCDADPGANMRTSTAQKLATTLRVSLADLLDEPAPLVEGDRYANRAEAVSAARTLRLSPAAIRRVQAEDPGEDRPVMYWFRRIETEAERDVPAAKIGRHSGKRARNR